MSTNFIKDFLKVRSYTLYEFKFWGDSGNKIIITVQSAEAITTSDAGTWEKSTKPRAQVQQTGTISPDGVTVSQGEGLPGQRERQE